MLQAMCIRRPPPPADPLASRVTQSQGESADCGVASRVTQSQGESADCGAPATTTYGGAGLVAARMRTQLVLKL
jgi:hypothetical protein